MATLLTTIIGVNIGYTAVLPYLADVARAARLTPLHVAVYFSAFAVMKALAQPVGGRLADRYGGVWTTAAALVVSAVGMVLAALAGDPVTAIAARVVWGVGDGLATPAVYRLASLLAARYGLEPAVVFGRVGAAGVSALALGPLLVGLVYPIASFRTVLVAAAVLTVVNAVVAVVALAPLARGESRPDIAPPGPPPGDAAPGDAAPGSAAPDDGRGPDKAVRMATVWWWPVFVFGLLDLVGNVLWGALEPLVPLAVAGTAGHAATGRAAVILTAGMAAFVVATLTLSKLPARLRRPGSGLVALLVVGVSCAALTWLRVLPVALAGIVVFMVAQAHVYLVAREGLQVYAAGSGRAWGLFGMLSDAGFILGPIVGVLVYGSQGDAAFALLGAFCVVAAPPVWILVRLVVRASPARSG